MANSLQPPRLRIGEDNEERHATWLELFYDLVFVVAVSQLAHNLSGDVTISGIFGFVVLFIPVWWSWIGSTMYANRFDNDDIGHRLLTGLQMVAAAALAINIHHGLGESSAGFAFCYALGRAVLVAEYIRAGIYIPEARTLTSCYATGFAVAAFLWLISVFLPTPWRFGLWTFGLIVDFATPLFGAKLQIKLPPHPSHLPERFGLFTMIVLGEAIIAVVNGVSEQKWDILSTIAAFFGLSIAFGFWWVYFDNLGGTPIQTARTQGKIAPLTIWLYTHLPLVIGITATGVGVEKLLLSQQQVALPDAVLKLLCGSQALCWLTLGVLHRLGVIRYCKIRARYRFGAVPIVLAIAIFGSSFLPITVIGLLALIALIQIVEDFSQSRPTTRLSEPEI